MLWGLAINSGCASVGTPVFGGNNMASLFEDVSCGAERIQNSVVYVGDVALGVIRPATVEGITQNQKYVLGGISGVVSVDSGGAREAKFAALLKSNSILFGGESEIQEVQALLNDEVSSRTASYFCCIAKTCDEVIDAFKRIRSAKALIIGCGGIGSLTALQLAGSGVQKIVLVDPDSVELSNLNRQFMWSRKDVGSLKVEVLKQCILARFPHVDVEVCANRVDDESLKELTVGVDVALLSADEPLGVAEVELGRLASRDSFLALSCGYYHNRAAVKVLSSNCEQPKVETLEKVEWKRSPGFIGPSFGPMNVEISGVIASTAIHALAFPDSDPSPANESAKTLSWCPFERQFSRL
ncbi:HesA/MoeB/ThiF family protein [Halopseudomonas maritima]|uniref:HesA/MoeB/ThiF family protein n=1 Tax=Halopseudomonas maritima TaxID=2918528 RepID=UPI001EEBF4CD|nr:ThiF family adenylyltransferase [Halopseudomonas maritima]UJJ32584.1 ThiF family adenylyltransferase [Halopseudomonas maritima]